MTDFAASVPEASTVKTSGRSSRGTIAIVVLCVIGFIVFYVLANYFKDASNSQEQTQQTTTLLPEPISTDHIPADDGEDDAAFITRHYGKPDADDSTAYDSPRPPIVTRKFVYRKEGVRIMFYPSGKLEDDPLSPTWKVIGYIFIPREQAITNVQAEDLLSDRLRYR